MTARGPVLAVIAFDAPGAEGDRLAARELAAELTLAFAEFGTLAVLPWRETAGASSLADREIWRRHGASHVLRGRFERTGQALAVELSLRDAPTGVQVWTQRVALAGADMLALRDEIVARIAFALALRQVPLPAERERARGTGPDADPGGSAPQQEIRFCKAPDGVRIAFAISGAGPPVVKAANWMSHLEYEWQSPVWRHWIDGLSAEHTLIRYDERGNGLSDRNVEDLSFEAMLADLESVIDAAGLDRFALLGLSQGCALSVAYAVRHPERVRCMILYGGYVKGWRSRGEPHEIARRVALGTLMREGWGQDSDAFRQVFTSLFLPGGSREHMDWFNELHRVTVSPEMAERLHDAFGSIDVSGLLPRVRTPTLVLHARGDRACPFEAGRAFAADIPGARFVALDSTNHSLLAHEPAFARFLDEARGFLEEHLDRAPAGPETEGPAPETAAALIHQGETWMVEYGGRRTVIGDMKGLFDLQRLLSAPDEEVHCLDLAGRGGDSDGGTPVLDARAKRAYQERLRDLQEELAEAGSCHDLARAERATAEMDALLEMLSQAVGLGGRKRTIGNLTERARTTVTWRIRHAIKKVEAAHPELGRHLANSVRTGTFCSYRPEKPTRWRVTDPGADQTSRTSRIASPSP